MYERPCGKGEVHAAHTYPGDTKYGIEEVQCLGVIAGSFIDLVTESGVLMPDGSPIPEGAPSLLDPGFSLYTTRIDAAGEYRASAEWLLSIYTGLLEKEPGSIDDQRLYTLAIQARKYLREVDRRSNYDLMCKRLQRAKIGQSTETRLVMESIISDIEREFL